MVLLKQNEKFCTRFQISGDLPDFMQNFNYIILLIIVGDGVLHVHKSHSHRY